ncbi:aaa family atpase [Ophiostoma piceae UAMH 11346]|uniref:Aaa family atpase n=1 Tax=Ophiostoma piceae (strain UAMH 11346) TaxID=1262450 RepID=S3CR19_OPHP1|nr:aaa family atpase [Ophiostoma piceae UAMH 11346]
MSTVEADEETATSDESPREAPPSSSTTDQSAPIVLRDVLAEMSALRERVQFLERLDVANSTLDDGEPLPIRQPTRRAQKWVQTTETKANERASERVKLGNGDGQSGDALSTEEIKDAHVILYDKGVRYFATEEEYDGWLAMHKRPIEGQRIPASLRPVYAGKLGPRNQWDQEEGSDWDSDESTRTRDFDYFQARLRGDFEWEIDRLNLQRQRYVTFKKKKQQKEDLKRLRARADQRQADDTPADGTETAHALLRMETLDWASFSDIFSRPRLSFSVICILEGEPKISTTVSFLKHLFKPQVAQSSADKDKALVTYNGHTALPERICISSEPLINLLARICDMEIQPGSEEDDTKVVLLRPYRMLTHYEADIRDMYEKLNEETARMRNNLPSIDAAPPAAADQASAVVADNVPEAPSVPAVVPPHPEYKKIKTELEHLGCLIGFMDDYLAKRVAWLRSVRCEKMFFSDIWHLYRPGDFVISTTGKQAYQVVSVDAGKHIGKDPFSAYGKWKDDADDERDNDAQSAVLNCVYIDYDGTTLGPVVYKVVVKKFDGERMISTMDVLPLRHYVAKSPEVARAMNILKDNPEAAEQLLDGEVAGLEKRLMERGHRFVDVAAVKHMYYAGLTVDKRDEVESQVMIDVQEAFGAEEISEKRPTFNRIPGIYDDRSRGEATCSSECCIGQNVHSDISLQSKAHEAFVASSMEAHEGHISNADPSQTTQPPVSLFPRNLAEVKADVSILSKADLMIMSYCVYGFVLRDRSWARLDLDNVSDIDKTAGPEDASADNDEEDDDDNGNEGDVHDDSSDDDDGGGKTAFSRLVLPGGHKRMVLSLVSQHFRNKASQKHRDERVDIVKGKGKGLIILLHGAPGVGKTTTAEGVAEKFSKPLFQITCGDLGSNAKEVEESLQKKFSLASRWDSILLLDEADVFLAARRRNDFSRNGLVAGHAAVFLRVLEYYTGILFLTTNRIGDLDEAFTSRIHMILHYPQLEELPTVKICRLNLAMIRKRYSAAERRIKIDKDAIEEHIREYWRANDEARWNGRQIRNACQTALALAEYDAQPSNKKYDLTVQSDAKVHLKVGHVKRVSEAYLKFFDYLKKVHGTDSETRAKELGLRAMEIFDEDGFKAPTTRPSGRGRRDHSGRHSGSANALHQFQLPVSGNMPTKQQPQLQPQPQPQTTWAQDQSRSQHLPYQPQRRQPSPIDAYGQPPPMDPQTHGVSAYGSSQPYTAAPNNQRLAPGQAYDRPVAQAPRDPQYAQDVPRSAPFAGQSYVQSNWNPAPAEPGAPPQPYHAPSAYQQNPQGGRPQQ